MENLADKMRVRLHLDECADRILKGKNGDIHKGTLNHHYGYYVSLMYPSVRKFHIELKKVAPLGEITIEGDTEAIVFIPSKVALANARLLRSAIHARRIKEMSPEAKAAGAERLQKWREKQTNKAT